jgi:hypothetical protein
MSALDEWTRWDQRWSVMSTWRVDPGGGDSRVLERRCLNKTPGRRAMNGANEPER